MNIDPKRVHSGGSEIWEVHINGGRIGTGLEAVAWARRVEELGAGEIVLTSMDADGTKDGYDLEITAAVSKAVSIPVVASGGAGAPVHLADAIRWAAPTRHLRPAFPFRRIHDWRNQTSHATARYFGAALGQPYGLVRSEAGETEELILVTDDKHDLEVDVMFRAAVKLEGSDLHLKVGRPPMVRVQGMLRPLKRDPIEDAEMTELCESLMTDRAREILKVEGGADFAHTLDVDGIEWRFRVNLLQQMGHMGLVARRVSNDIPSFANLHLPPIIEELCQFEQGLILVAGVTGSGKSTTIASMLDWINHHHRKHILTLEDPIEFVFEEDKCLINQREIGIDVADFEIGMKHAVREDPDVMLVGEMRDRESFATAIHAAEDGAPGIWYDSRVERCHHDRPYFGPVPGGSATCASQRARLEHEGHHRPETITLVRRGH